MNGISHRKLTEFYNSIFRCDSVETMSQHLLGPLARLFDASSVALLCYSDQSGRMTVSRGAVHAIDVDTLDIYSRYYFTEDPIFALAKSLNRNGGRNGNYVTEYKDVTRHYELTDNFGQFLTSIGIGEIVTGVFPVTHIGTDIVNLGIHRKPGEAPFDAEEVALFNQVKGALSCVISNSIKSDTLHLCRSLIEVTQDWISAVGVVAIRDDGGVCHATRAGLNHLEVLVDLHFQGDVRTLTRAMRRELGRTEAFSVETRFGALTLTARRLAGDASGGRMLFLFTTEGDEHFLQRCRAHRLSEREIEISRLISAGLPDKAIGNQLSISTRTVQNHLRSIFRKTDVHSRTQLISRIGS